MASARDLDRLVAVFNEKNVVAFVGAGLSVPLGLPSWKDLIQRVWSDTRSEFDLMKGESRLWMDRAATEDPLWGGEVLASSGRRDRVLQSVESLIKNPKKVFSPNHALISAMSFRGYITTNYDEVLDIYIRVFSGSDVKPIVPSDSTRLPERIFNHRFLVKLHGCFSISRESIVLSQSDYYKLDGDRAIQSAISQIMVENTIIVVGYSLRDPDFRKFILDRYYLYRGNVPPMYVLANEETTSEEEQNHYRNQFRIIIVPVSPKSDFQEVYEILMNIYCTYHKTDVRKYANQIKDLLNQRSISIHSRPVVRGVGSATELRRASALLYFFRSGVHIDAFSDYCQMVGIQLTMAHYRAISRSIRDTIFPSDDQQPSEAEATDFAQVFVNVVSMLGVLGADRILFTEERRRSIRSLLARLHVAVSYVSCCQIIFSANQRERFDIIKQAFRQTGDWAEWSDVLSLIIQNAPHLDPLVGLMVNEEKAWLSYWQRDANGFANAYSVIAGTLTASALQELEVKRAFIEGRMSDVITQCSTPSATMPMLSCHGRALFALAIKSKGTTRTNLLIEAGDKLRMAENAAVASGNIIEQSVHAYYQAMVAIEEGDLVQAELKGSEARRIDLGVVGRKPGQAWLTLYDYRLAIASKIDVAKIGELRSFAKASLGDLGILEIDKMLDEEYYY